MAKRTEGFVRAYADHLIETWAKDVQSFEVESTFLGGCWFQSSVAASGAGYGLSLCCRLLCAPAI